MAVTQKEPLRIYVSLADAKQLREIAATQRRTLVSILREAVEDYLAKQSNGSEARSTQGTPPSRQRKGV